MTTQAANGAAGGEPVVDVQAMAAGARARAVYVEEAKAALAARGEGAHAVESLGYGEDDAFYGLRDICLDIQSGVFKYTVCAFEKAAQAESGNPEILIGTWVRSMGGAWGRAQRAGGGGGLITVNNWMVCVYVVYYRVSPRALVRITFLTFDG